MLSSVSKSPGPADILVNTILTARLLARLDLLPFGKSSSTAISMFHSEEIFRTATIAFFSESKYFARPDTVVGTSETIKLSMCLIGIADPLDVLEFGYRPAQYTKPDTLLDAGHGKITEILFVGKISRKVYSPKVLFKDEAFALDVMVTGAANEGCTQYSR